MKKRIISLLIALIMLIGLLPMSALAKDDLGGIPFGGGDYYAADGRVAFNALENEKVSIQSGKAAEDGLAEGAEKGDTRDGSLTVLAFTSDTHNMSNNTAANRLGEWLDNIEPIYQQDVEVMAFGGDMANASASATDYWVFTQADMAQLTQRDITGVYTTGNHEHSPGQYSASSNNAAQKEFKIGTEGASGNNYRIYCLGSESNSSTYSQSQITSLKEYIDGVEAGVPIIIITHFPLHYYSGRTTNNASGVIDLLNDAVTNDGKKIVFLWGHNHTMADTFYDYIYRPGDSIPTTSSSSSNKTIQFYYGAAGCMSDSEYSRTGSAYVKGKGLVITINSKNQLSFTYYDASGNNVTEGGTLTEQDPVPAEDIAVSPKQIDIEVGRSGKLSVTFTPSDTTNKGVIWSSSDTAVATVTNGKVKGVSVGDATITATSVDGRFTDTCEVHVNPRSTNEIHYVIKIGSYVLSTERSSDQYSSSSSGWGGNGNTYTGLAAVAASPAAGTDEETRWIIEESDDGNGYYIMSLDGRYLNATYTTTTSGSPWNSSSQSDLKLDDTPDVWVLDSGVTLDNWEVDGSYLMSTNSTRYLCEETGNNGSHLFSVRSRDNADETTIEEASDPVAVTGVTVSPKTETVQERKTVQLTATVAPANATNKNVSWSSSDTTVATVDENGKVRGVSVGTAVITAKTSEGNFKDTATITVEENPSTEQHYVIVIDGYALSTDRSPNTANGGSSSYTYTGLAGVAFTEGNAADDNIRWIIEETEGGYYIKNLDGLYLNATYTSGSNSGQGNLKVDSTSDVWVLDSGYSLESGTVDGSKLKSTNASGTATSDKYLAYENDGNLFTVRSSGNADTITIEEASDPVAVTGVTVSPTSAEIEARKTVQLTATVSPEDATNKKVTWSSSDTSVATVDENGKVRGVAEGPATITATTVDGGKTATCTINVTPSTSTEQHYVIVIDGYALSTDRSPNTANGGSSSYTYTGLAGVAFTEGNAADDNIRWIIEETTGGYYIKSLEGLYLNATYTSGSNSGQGNLKVDSTSDVWVLDSGYSLESGTVDGSKLKSTNASGTATSDKYLAYENDGNLFTVRSSGNADTITIEEASDPVAVTGVTVSPTSAEIEARKTVQLTATVSPENATNKKVTWSSSNTSAATVDENGKVKGVAEGTATITATTADGGKTASCTITVIPNENPQTGYIIMIGDYAMSTDPSNDQLENSGSGSQRYYYTGLASIEYNGEDAPDSIWWNIVETDGGVYIMSTDGRYLNSTYESNSTGGYTGTLKLDDTQDVWVLEGTIEDWMIDGSMLKSTNSTKFLAEETGKNGTHFFTIRSESNADETIVIDPTATIEERFIETTALEDGKEYIIGVTKDSDSVYVIKNTAGTSTGNTGSATLTVNPASGSDSAYIENEDETVVWKYASSNQYMSTSNSHYLGYESSTYLPRTSSSGKAITYSGSTLSIGTNHYLTCNAGTFETTTTASDAANVRLFVKTVEVITCEHTFGDWEVTTPATCTAAGVETRTCSLCGATETRTIAALGHAWGEWTETTAPTCTTKGEETRECSRCGATETREVEATGHTLTKTAAVAATCTTAGNSEYYTCSACGKYFSDAEGTTEIEENSWVITALGHNLISHDAQAPTCTEAGWDAYDTCSRCDYTTYEEIPATGHTWSNPIWLWTDDYSEADVRFTCQTCGYTNRVTAEVEITTTQEATCTEAGVKAYTATADFDGKPYSDTKTRSIEKLEHVPGEPVHENVVDATYEAEGSYDEVIYCSVCGEELSRATHIIPKLMPALTITAQPKSVTVSVGDNAIFSVGATGSGLTYRWQWKSPGGSWQNISSGGNTASLTVVGAVTRNGYQYRCIVTGANGTAVTSDTATLTVSASGPSITAQPKSVTVSVGDNAIFSVGATGSGLTYRWQWKSPGGSWQNISSGGNTASLTVVGAVTRNGYQYRCIVTGANGTTVTSDTATLTVK